MKHENLAYWYLRLNGFLTTCNFIVHPDRGSDQRTEVDVYGIRFPDRRELLENSLTDVPVFETEKPLIIISEVTTGECKLNDALMNRGNQNIERVLSAIGIFPSWKIIEENASKLYECGGNEEIKNSRYKVMLNCIGDCKNGDIEAERPQTIQIIWKEVCDFIYDRFEEYNAQKANTEQWSETGNCLWDFFKDSDTKEEFWSNIDIEE